MLLVDRLVYGVHTTGQPAAGNLFAGHPTQVLAALDGLAGVLTAEQPPPHAHVEPPRDARPALGRTERRRMTSRSPRGRSDRARSEVVLIGPMGAGKTTLARLLAARLGCRHVEADEVSAPYYDEIGYDREYVARMRDRDFRAAIEYRRPFVVHAVERLLAEHRECVIDFGAGAVVEHHDPMLRARLERALAPFANVVLVLPAPDWEESRRVLRERRGPLVFHGLDLDARAPEYAAGLATLTVYTAGRTSDECVDELLRAIGVVTPPDPPRSATSASPPPKGPV